MHIVQQLTSLQQSLQFSLQSPLLLLLQLQSLLADCLQGRDAAGEQADDGGGGCGSAVICHQVGHGEVVFVTESCHNGAGERGNGTTDLFIVKNHQVFPASPSPGQHKSIQIQLRLSLAELFKDRTDLCSDSPLNRDGNNKKLSQGPSF